MRFLWPFKAEYLIAHIDDAYSETIVARSKRDYVWIMTREPVLDEARYARLVERVGALGYDTSKLRRVPQRWPDPGHPASEAVGPLAAATRRRGRTSIPGVGRSPAGKFDDEFLERHDVDRLPPTGTAGDELLARPDA